MSISDARIPQKPSIVKSLEDLKNSVNNDSSPKFHDHNFLLTKEKSRSISFTKSREEFKLILFGNVASPLYFNTSGDIIKTIDVMLRLLNIP